jgi:hypothetical protein
MLQHHNQFEMPPISLETQEHFFISLFGRATEIREYTIPPEVGTYWYEVGEGQLHLHLLQNREYVPSLFEEMDDVSQYRLNDDNMVPVGKPIYGIRIEQGFRVFFGTEIESHEATFYVLDKHKNDLLHDVPTSVFPDNPFNTTEGYFPQTAILTTQTHEYGRLDFSVGSKGVYDPSLITLHIVFHDGWPIVTKVFYDGEELDLAHSNTITTGTPTTQMALYG